MLDVQAIRAEMPVTRQYNFLDHAAVAPISAPAAAAMRRYIDEAESHAYARGGLYPEAKRVRQLAARLLNCHAEEVTFVKNTSEGISFVANGLQFSKGDNIVTTGVEFPANIYPWMNLADRGVELRQVPSRGARLAIDDRLHMAFLFVRLLQFGAIRLFLFGERNLLTASSAAGGK